MPSLSNTLTLLLNPAGLPHIVRWLYFRQPVHTFSTTDQSPELRECFRYLRLTSRSFAAVIQELHPELIVPVCLFYLILRGLDTIEDDMTIVDIEEKSSLLLNFHSILGQDGWTFDGNGPDEKDRELLVHFDVVIAEYKKIKPQYRQIITEITERMGSGMNDYLRDEKFKADGIVTVEQYHHYCYHVAGIVGEGLTRLFVAAEFAKPALLDKADLHLSMGRFLQQINIIRDVREDFIDGRRFWPKDVWSKHAKELSDLARLDDDDFSVFFTPADQAEAIEKKWRDMEKIRTAMVDKSTPEAVLLRSKIADLKAIPLPAPDTPDQACRRRAAALDCASEMVSIALRSVPDCLLYMTAIKEQSVFNFVAIPQIMAIATLALVFRNTSLFDRNVKISKGDACKLMYQSTQTTEVLFRGFRDCVRQLRAKNDPNDPQFLTISTSCAGIEKYIQHVFPPPKPGQLVGPSSDPAAPKGLLFSHIVKPIMYFVIFLVLRYAAESGFLKKALPMLFDNAGSQAGSETPIHPPTVVPGREL